MKHGDKWGTTPALPHRALRVSGKRASHPNNCAQGQKKKKKIQEAQIWTDFTEEAAFFQDGQVSLTIANNNNNKHLRVLIHLPMRSGTIFSPILKKRIFSPILKKRIPRHREAKQHAQGHTAWKGQSLDESPGRLLPEVTLLTSSLCHFSQRFLPLTATQRCGRRPGESLKVSRSSSFLFIYASASITSLR